MTAVIVVFTALLVIEWAIALDKCEDNVGRMIYTSVKLFLFIEIMKHFF